LKSPTCRTTRSFEAARLRRDRPQDDGSEYNCLCRSECNRLRKDRRPDISRLALATLPTLAFVLAPALAEAHPHVWADVASEVLYDAKGQIVAIRHHWRFDEGFSTYALQGLDLDGDGEYSPEELEPLARENVESVADFDYFTFLSAGDYLAGFAAPTEYHLTRDGDRLTLHYTLPLAQPLFTRGAVRLEVYDPEYYVAFSLPSAEAVRLVDAPADCRIAVHVARGPEAAAAEQLATLGAEQRELPADMQMLTAGIENSADISCGAGAAVAGVDSSGAPQNAGDAVSQMAQADGDGGDLRALPSASAPAAAVQPPRPQRVAPDGLLARIAALQASFNRDLTDGLKALKEGGGFWWLGGFSFLYGVVHAAGPGHGKVVISSYLIANEQRVRRGVAIAFLAAFVQALVAIGIVGIMAVALDMTSVAITGTAQAFEAGSFALVAALGLYLLSRKGRQALAVYRGGDAHAHHDHHHHHGAAFSSRLPGGTRATPVVAKGATVACHAGHAQVHSGDGQDLKGLASRNPSPSPSPQGGGEAHYGAAAAVLSVGIRPCTGALVVLVFALAQGVFWAGIASTFLMALGTGLAVALLAALAVSAKGIARRISTGDDRRAGQVMLAVEIVAALAITALGAILFAGALYA
jgi:nickel/cobalt transporter (NicO) family protein